MKKRVLTFFALTICVLTIGVQAMELRGITTKPRISFNGTTAICTAACYGDHSDDVINATLTLYQGSTYVDSWSNSGVDSVSVRGEGKVKSGKSYTLKLTYSVNGVSKPSVSATATGPGRRAKTGLHMQTQGDTSPWDKC